MILTPEEKKKIYEEEKARAEAQEKIKKQKKGVGCGASFIIIFVFIIALVLGLTYLTAPTTKTSTKTLSLTENSPEYQRMVYDRFKIVTEDPDIDSIKVDGSLLYINFIKPQPLSEYKLVAQLNAIQFSNFKKSKLGVSTVTVFVTYKGKIVAGADAQYGKLQ